MTYGVAAGDPSRPRKVASATVLPSTALMARSPSHAWQSRNATNNPRPNPPAVLVADMSSWKNAEKSGFAGCHPPASVTVR
jgi:hypothetical protein